jgi:hypothetical protein
MGAPAFGLAVSTRNAWRLRLKANNTSKAARGYIRARIDNSLFL